MLDGGKKHYAHMINGTLCACQRLICALLENHQDEDGVKLPTVLQPYMHGIARYQVLSNIEDYDLDKKNAVKAMRTAARKKDRFQATTLTPLEPSNRHLQRRITKDSGGANTHHVATNRQQKQIKKKYSAAEGENYLRLFTKRGLEWLDDRLKLEEWERMAM